MKLNETLQQENVRLLKALGEIKYLSSKNLEDAKQIAKDALRKSSLFDRKTGKRVKTDVFHCLIEEECSLDACRYIGSSHDTSGVFISILDAVVLSNAETVRFAQQLLEITE